MIFRVETGFWWDVLFPGVSSRAEKEENLDLLIFHV